VKSAKDERHGLVSATFRDRTIAEGSSLDSAKSKPKFSHYSD